jgi:hypothetical protein
MANQNWGNLLRETNSLGSSKDSKRTFSDMPSLETFKARQILPQMRSIDVYHDTRFVYGLEVHYDGAVSHAHLGNAVTAPGVIKETFTFQQIEYISKLTVRCGWCIDRIEFTTNFGRTFRAGGDGGGPKTIEVSLGSGQTACFVGFAGDLGHYVQSLRAFYIPIDSGKLLIIHTE